MPIRPALLGEVLFDQFSSGSSVLGGAPFNVAWHLRGFGVDPLVISRVGSDPLGQSIIQSMESWGMDTSGVQIDPAYPTGVVDITMEGDAHQFHIRPDQAYDQIDAAAALEAYHSSGVEFLYHGTLAMRQAPSQAAREALKNSGAPVFLDINLRDPWWSAQQVYQYCQESSFLKVNDEELLRISGLFGLDEDELEEKAASFQQQLNLELLLVTRGAAGATAWDCDGCSVSIAPDRSIEIVDTVGAGDAFTAVTILGLLSEWPLGMTLTRAQAFANSVCEIRGATVADPSFYETHRRAWAKQ